MDAVSHQLKPHHNQPQTVSSAILPSSSLRDIISLIFILLSLPQTLSLVLLIIYILLESKFIVGKFIVKLFIKDNDLKFFNSISVVVRFIQILMFNSIIYYCLKIFLIKKKYYLFNYLIILSKSIISCDLIGSLSINTSVSNKKFLSKIQYENKFLNNNLINLIICFAVVNYVNYLIGWLDFRNYHFNHYFYNKCYIILSLHIINSSIFKIFINKKNVEEIPLNNHTDYSNNEKILNIHLNDGIKLSEPNRIIKNSIAIKNFENFIRNPFNNNKSLILKNKYNSSVHITYQPFWSVLAGFKAIVQDPNLFDGKFTKCKNNGGEFIKSPNSLIKVSILLINDSKILLKFLDNNLIFNEQNFKIKINNINWSYFKLFEKNNELYLVIYGLTSLFQYEIDLIHDNKNLNHFIVNTIDHKKVLNKSLKENSSLVTLQISLISTIKSLNDLKLKFKKFKKDENKKATELKNNIDNLKSKISKYNNKQVNDSRTFGKLKGLKHIIIQLENDITNLQNKLNQLNSNEAELKESFKQKERNFISKVQQLDNEFNDYEKRMNNERNKLKLIKLENQSTDLKSSKSLNKQQIKREDISKLQNDLKIFKKVDILLKFEKRIKKINEKFEVILPKVLNATSDLQKEFEELLND